MTPSSVYIRVSATACSVGSPALGTVGASPRTRPADASTCCRADTRTLLSSASRHSWRYRSSVVRRAATVFDSVAEELTKKTCTCGNGSDNSVDRISWIKFLSSAITSGEGSRATCTTMVHRDMSSGSYTTFSMISRAVGGGGSNCPSSPLPLFGSTTTRKSIFGIMWTVCRENVFGVGSAFLFASSSSFVSPSQPLQFAGRPCTTAVVSRNVCTFARVDISAKSLASTASAIELMAAGTSASSPSKNRGHIITTCGRPPRRCSRRALFVLRGSVAAAPRGIDGANGMCQMTFVDCSGEGSVSPPSNTLSRPCSSRGGGGRSSCSGPLFSGGDGVLPSTALSLACSTSVSAS
eukprot:PhM_4_TR2820/c0_g1_i1/m.33136